MTWQFPMVGVITVALMVTLARYQVKAKSDAEALRMAAQREQAHVVRLISQ